MISRILVFAFLAACGVFCQAQDFNGWGIGIGASDLVRVNVSNGTNVMTIRGDNSNIPPIRTIAPLGQSPSYAPKAIPSLSIFYIQEISEGGYQFLEYGLDLEDKHSNAAATALAANERYDSRMVTLSYKYFFNGQRKGPYALLGCGFGTTTYSTEQVYPQDLNGNGSPRCEATSFTSTDTLQGSLGCGYSFSRHWSAELAFIYARFSGTDCLGTTAYVSQPGMALNSPATGFVIHDMTVRMNKAAASLRYLF